MRKSVFVLVGIILAVLLASCASPVPELTKELGRGQNADQAFVESVQVEKEVAKQAEAPAAQYEGAESAQGDVVPAERMIIVTGNLGLLVPDTTDAVAEIQDVVQGLDGYVVNSNTWRAGERMRANLTVRVPAASFDVAMDQIKALANVVNRSRVSGEDVTEQYTDLSARLRTLKATEEELLELLSQVRERTGKAEDILAIYRELTDIRSQIERIQGQVQYLERMTAMATINIELEPDVVDTPLGSDGRWRPNATLSSALSRLVDTLRLLADGLIWFVFYVAPILLLVLLPLGILIALINWWRKRKRAAAS
jgi:hypothetical protein